ncbi:MAG: hypothetical protein KDK00_10045 [Rhodobacteraceae bacterium]|nr:hypothetical protein [Paracoccaceae bacterium]
MQEWWSTYDLDALQHPALPNSPRAIRRLADKRQWASDKNRCREVPGNLRGDPKYMRLPGFKVAIAQWEIVKLKAPFAGNTFKGHVYRLTQTDLPDMTADDWIAVMNTFGERIRSLQSEGVL